MRRGVSLIEVLVAIFVTAIGLLSILALFPVGAFSMRHAIDNGRVVQCSQNAAALAAALNLKTDSGATGGNAFSDPTAGILPAAVAGSPSYPVFVDPIGSASLASGGSWLGGLKAIPRKVPSYVTSYKLGLQYFSLMDDLSFQQDGSPKAVSVSPGGNIIEREILYSWAYMLHQPALNSGLTEMSVVIYSHRPLGFALPSSERIFAAAGTAKGNTLTISYAPGIGQAAPELKAGAWLLDCSQEATAAGIKQNGPVHGKYYRVVNATPGTDAAGNPAVSCELQERLLMDVSSVLIQDNVLEVIERGLN
jgi:hypothetical protein